MHKPNVGKVIKTVRYTVGKHSPEILTGIGIAGMVTTAVLVGRATPKALQLIEEAKKEQQTDELKPLDVVKVTWKPYVPAVITGAVSIACLIGANSVNTRRNAALATAYKLSETALAEYRDKVIETIGEKKEQTIQDKVDKAVLEKHPVSKSEVIVIDGGNTLCYDTISGRYFKSNINAVQAAVNELNKRMIHDMYGYVSVNDLYDELGLDHTYVGDDLGWNTDEPIDISFGSQIAEDGKPCVVLTYRVAPKYNYDK